VETKIDSDAVLADADHDKTQSDLADLSTKVDSDAVLEAADHDKSQSDIADLSTKLGSDVLALETALDSDFLAIETKVNSDAVLADADHDKSQSDIALISTKLDSDATLETADHDKTQSDIADLSTKQDSDMLLIQSDLSDIMSDLTVSSGGAGTVTDTITVYADDGSTPLDGAEVSATNDVAGVDGEVARARQYSDTNGQVTFNLNEGDYWIHVQQGGYMFTTTYPKKMTVSSTSFDWS